MRIKCSIFSINSKTTTRIFVNNFFYAIKLKMFRLGLHEARLFFTTALLLLMFNTSFAQLQRSLTVDVKFKIEEGDLKDSYLVITKQGGSSQTLPGTSRFKVDLDFNATYVLSFNKPGYITKKIELNTTMDDERRSQGVHFYDFVVVLFKQYDGVNIVVFNQPVAKIQYSKKIDDFDYDTDYTKSIRSALDDAEKELKKKQEEEKKNPKPPPKDTTLAKINKPVVEEKKQDAIAENKKPAEEPKKPMEKQKGEETPPVNNYDKSGNTDNGGDTKKKALANGGEDDRKAMQGKEGSDSENKLDAKKGDDGNTNLSVKTGNDAKSNGSLASGQDKETTSSNNSGNDKENNKTEGAGSDKSTDEKNKPQVAPSQKKLQEESGADNSNPVANKDGGKDNLNAKANSQAGSDVYVEPKKEVVKAKDDAVFMTAPTINVKIDREEINEDKRTILNVWVTRGNRTIMYSRIKYSWGGVFYFKDMKTSISEHYFNQAIAGN